MILVDTNVWVHYLRGDGDALEELLKEEKVLMHSMILGELSCHNLADRAQRIDDWRALPMIGSLTDDRVMSLIETESMSGAGIGFVDAHLIGAVKTAGNVQIWTRDNRLHNVASRLDIAFSEKA